MSKLKNMKHEKFVQSIINGVDQKEAYKLAYPKAMDTTAEVNSTRLMKREDINNRFIDILDTTGLTDLKLAQQINELSIAKQELSHKGIPTGHSIPDNRIRLDTLKLILQVKGQLQPEGTNQTNYYLNDSMIDKLGSRLDKVLGMFKGNGDIIEVDAKVSQPE